MNAKGALATGLGLLIGRRRKRYRKLLKFNPRQDFIAGFSGQEVQIIPARAEKNALQLPPIQPGIGGALLELDVRANTRGYFDPALEFRSGDFRDVQYVDRGASGRRFFNVTRLLAECSGGSPIELCGRWLQWDGQAARLHVCREGLSKNDRLLVISPHPDDAEIAAYGAYSSTKSTIVTLTAGDASKEYRNLGAFPPISRALLAKIRVWDSITIPGLGGADMENAINLCYPDGRLSEMRKEPGRDFRADGEEVLDFAGLRRLNSSSLISATDSCSWNSLIQDLQRILSRVQPTIIVTPHPALDPHPDHMAATAAVYEAMAKVELKNGRFFYTCVHNRYSELWPFGPLGSGVAHIPVPTRFDCQAQRFYSHALSPQLQLEKFIAVEAMHDLRDIAWPRGNSVRRAVQNFRMDLRALRDGLPRTPVSYLRRSIRPDEPFFVSDFGSPALPPGAGGK